MFILAQKMLGYWTMHFLCFYIFLRFWGLFSFKKTHTFFSLEFLVKNDLSYLSGICFGHYYIYISPNDYTVQTQCKCSVLEFGTPSSPVSFTVHYVGRQIIKEDGVTSRNNQLQSITQMAYHVTTKKIIVLAK